MDSADDLSIFRLTPVDDAGLDGRQREVPPGFPKILISAQNPTHVGHPGGGITLRLMNNELHLWSTETTALRFQEDDHRVVGAEGHHWSFAGLSATTADRINARSMLKEPLTTEEASQILKRIVRSVQGSVRPRDDEVAPVTRSGKYSIHADPVVAWQSMMHSRFELGPLSDESQEAFLDHFEADRHLTTLKATVIAWAAPDNESFWELSTLALPNGQEKEHIRLWKLSDFADGDLLTRELAKPYNQNDKDLDRDLKDLFEDMRTCLSSAECLRWGTNRPTGRLTLFGFDPSLLEGTKACLALGLPHVEETEISV